MELIVTLHGQHAATLDAGDDRWLHARTTSMGAMSARISAAWTEKPATRQLNCWLDGCLPENGLLGRYLARAQSMLQAAGCGLREAEGRRDSLGERGRGVRRRNPIRHRSEPEAPRMTSGYERLTEREIGR